ncbi:hypothetical protein E2320_022318 [Naja naja]|nr:hypothetical protein E2320_022318 [Naja naja]
MGWGLRPTARKGAPSQLGCPFGQLDGGNLALWRSPQLIGAQGGLAEGHRPQLSLPSGFGGGESDFAPPPLFPQVCLKGKIHIFKYLNAEACSKSRPDLAELAQGRPAGFGTCLPDNFYPSRQHGGLDSGFHSVDSGSKRWSGNEVQRGRPNLLALFPGLREGLSLWP